MAVPQVSPAYLGRMARTYYPSTKKVQVEVSGVQVHPCYREVSLGLVRPSFNFLAYWLMAFGDSALVRSVPSVLMAGMSFEPMAVLFFIHVHVLTM